MKKLESSFSNMAIVLTLISVIAAGLLAFINKSTQEPIREINEKNLQQGIKDVILGENGGELSVSEPETIDGYILYKTDKGTAVQAVQNGFGGPLTVLVGFNEAGDILGYTILSTNETPGLGIKAAEWFQKDGKGNIIGLNPGKKELNVKSKGGDVDAITGSTITSSAFLAAVNAAYKTFKGQSHDVQSGASKQAHHQPTDSVSEQSNIK